ncbi:MAG: hypothetical protein FWD71_12800 [Oscillospiraceae bacterium]|nr:hypothetical protein [Oscillospiraceae bacterium]
MIGEDNVVQIFDSNKNPLGTGLLLNSHIATVDHILNAEKDDYIIKYKDKEYYSNVVYRGKKEFIDIAMLSVEIKTSYTPTYYIYNDEFEFNVVLKGFPKEPDYKQFTNGRKITGKTGLSNFMNKTEDYPYSGDFITIKSGEKITPGFSGAPVFIYNVLIGFVARIQPNEDHYVTNVIPVKYFISILDKKYKRLFGQKRLAKEVYSVKEKLFRTVENQKKNTDTINILALANINDVIKTTYTEQKETLHNSVPKEDTSIEQSRKVALENDDGSCEEEILIFTSTVAADHDIWIKDLDRYRVLWLQRRDAFDESTYNHKCAQEIIEKIERFKYILFNKKERILSFNSRTMKILAEKRVEYFGSKDGKIEGMQKELADRVSSYKIH